MSGTCDAKNDNDSDFYDEREEEMSYMTCQICKQKQVVRDEANEVSKVQ